MKIAPAVYPLARTPLDGDGNPLFRISYTMNGTRHVTLLGKPCQRWAHMHAQRLAREYGWTELVIGKWNGALPIRPSRWTRTLRDEHHLR